ncbi:MAG: ammonium transporter [Ancalomicrobiaceae bacterium]|nr:ammonium transporter [Ancalomicrobiaceae bacterium]
MITNRSLVRFATVGAIALGLMALSAHGLYADDAPAAAAVVPPAPPVPNKGDVTWMLISTALVLLMSVPGLAMFYAGLVRTKNVLSVYVQVFAGFCLLAILWALYGYSVAFTGNDNATFAPFFGGFSKAFLSGLTSFDPASGMSFSNAATFSKGVVIPEMVYMVFQLTFATITPALIVGAFAERMKFTSVMLFLVLWFTFAYLPIAHMVWFWQGPDAYTLSQANFDTLKGILGEDSVKKFLADLTAAGTDKAKIADVLSSFSDALGATNGFLFNKGALDFAGGTVVHVNAGIAGLVCAIVLGPRIGLGKENMAPHNLTMSAIGAALLWFGWFGFNAGSNLEATGFAVLAFTNTLLATAAAGLAWMFAEAITRGHASALGLASGIVAGLVAVTPAAGWVGPMGAIIIGVAAGVICYWAVTSLKNWFGYDDALDVFGVHGVGGIVGALLTGVFNAPYLGGTGVTNYAAVDSSTSMATYDMKTQMISQCWAVGTAIVVSGVVSLVALLIIKVVIGLRPTDAQEREGLDLTSHGERAYN